MNDRPNAYLELQRAPWWIYVVGYGVGLFTVVPPMMPAIEHLGFFAFVREGGWIVLLVLLVPFGLLLLILKLLYMRTSLESGQLTIIAGMGFPFRVLRVSVSEIESAEVISYSALANLRRFWRIPIPNPRVVRLRMRGNQDVQLVLRNGNKLLIGSITPQRLVDEVQKQMS